MGIPVCLDKSIIATAPLRVMVKHVRGKLPKLGVGSSRVVFESRYRRRVSALKVAMNRKGLAQNIEEIKYLTNPEFVELGVTPPIIDYDHSSKPRWLQMGVAQKISSSVFKQHTGVDLDSFIYRWERSCSDIPESFQILKIKFPDLHITDFDRLENWGLYRGKLVLVDLGFNTTSDVWY